MPDIVYAGSRARIGQINRLRHTVAFQPITSTAGPTTSGTQQAGITTASITFKSGRAYQITYKGTMLTNASSDQGSFEVHKGTATGSPTYINSGRLQSAATAGSVGFYLANIVVNNGADVTAVLVGTYHRASGSSGTGVALFGSTTNPSYIQVEDVGPASDYPSASPV